ncbi:hypothetical protein [Sphingomonas sp. dw_22]|uniref:hypothetical protein n=1 Tax=Sphingomonas sp. dw_22 TaxID=2721175 RepID=UPI002116E367|nr:hypothetical protein [Sphingomonas sp. dw_22]
MMPLITRRSSTRETSRTLSGSGGLSRANCVSLNQNSLKSMFPLPESMNHIRAAKGIPFMDPDPGIFLTLVSLLVFAFRSCLNGIGCSFAVRASTIGEYLVCYLSGGLGALCPWKSAERHAEPGSLRQTPDRCPRESV